MKRAIATESCRGCNIIIVDIDVLRADAIDCVNAYSRTPNICEFAKKSVYFKQNSSQSDMTLPSFVSFGTSLYPISHQIWNELYTLENVPYKTIGEILQEKGYSTSFMGFYRSHNKVTVKGYQESLDVGYVLHKDFKPHEYIINLKSRGKPFLFYIYTADLHFPYLPAGADKMDNPYTPPPGTPRTRDEYDQVLTDYVYKNYEKIFTEKALEENQDLFANPSENRYKIYWLFLDYSTDRDKMPKYLIDSWKPFEQTFMKFLDIRKAEGIGYLKENYLSALKIVDKQIGELLKIVTTDPMFSGDTLLVLRSDHGEEFMEHGKVEHSNNLYQELIHTPLIIYAPGIKPSEVNVLSEDIDVLPTLLDITGYEISALLEGESLLSVMKSPEAKFREYQLSQKGAEDYLATLRYRDWKIILKEGNPIELYNLKNDPKEKNNIIYEQRPIVTSMTDLYKDVINSLPKLRTNPFELPTQINEEKRKRLMEEGYF